VEHPIETEHSERLVELVFVPLVGRNLDDRGHLMRRIGSGGNVVPRLQAGLSWSGHGVSGLKSVEVYPEGDPESSLPEGRGSANLRAEARVAERQTQWTQNPPGATPCEFESRLGHRSAITWAFLGTERRAHRVSAIRAASVYTSRRSTCRISGISFKTLLGSRRANIRRCEDAPMWRPCHDRRSPRSVILLAKRAPDKEVEKQG
jgi:hypothetical protein